MNEITDETEVLLRSVRPKEMFWRSDHTLSSAAFKDREGLSVDRVWDRDIGDAVQTMRSRFEGTVVGVTVGDCHDVNAIAKYLPVETNYYHSEIHQSSEKAMLTDGNAKKLAAKAIILSE